MNKRLLTGALIAVGALIFVGSVSAQAYYTHELAERVAAQNTAAAPTVPVNTAKATPTLLDPWAAMNADMARMQAQMEQMFNTALHNPGGMDFIDGQGAAKVSLNEKGNNYVVTASIPGAKKNDINIHLSGRLLTLSSNDTGGSTQQAKNGQVTQQEHYASRFEQAFTLPGPVNASAMSSKFKNGVLTLTIPKAHA